jgi:hypothetical protein
MGCFTIQALTSHHKWDIMIVTSAHFHISSWFVQRSLMNSCILSFFLSPYREFIAGTAPHFFWYICIHRESFLWSYQWIPIDIFIQQVSRLGFTNGSIPGTSWQQRLAKPEKQSMDDKDKGKDHLPLRHKRCHPNGIPCLHWVPVLFVGTIFRMQWY